MTVPKIRTVSRNGSRYYYHPETKERAASVTSITGMLPKPFLQYWAAKVVAEKAVDNLGQVIGLVLAGDRQGAVDYLKRSPGRDTRDAANVGDTVHELTAAYAEGKAVGRLHPEIRPFVEGFQRITEALELEFIHTETTIWNNRLGMAGQFDQLVRIDRKFLDGPEYAGEKVILIGDTKTTRSGVHAEVALQLSGYSQPDNVIFLPDGNRWIEHPLPGPVEGGLVFHLRPEGSKVVPINLTVRLPHPIMKAEDGSPLELGLSEVLTALATVHFWDKELNTAVLTPAITEWSAT